MLICWLRSCLIFLLQSAVVAKNWIVWIRCESLKFEYEVFAKAWIKHEVVAKAWIKHKVVVKAYICYNVASGYEKNNNNPARRAGEKNILAPILSKQNFLAQTKKKTQAPAWISNGPCLMSYSNWRKNLDNKNQFINQIIKKSLVYLFIYSFIYFYCYLLSNFLTSFSALVIGY